MTLPVVRDWRQYLTLNSGDYPEDAYYSGGDFDPHYMRSSPLTEIIQAIGDEGGLHVHVDDILKRLLVNGRDGWHEWQIRQSCAYLVKMKRLVSTLADTYVLPEQVGAVQPYAWVHFTEGSTLLHAVTIDDLNRKDIHPLCGRRVSVKDWEKFARKRVTVPLSTWATWIGFVSGYRHYDRIFIRQRWMGDFFSACPKCEKMIAAAEKELGGKYYSLGDFSYHCAGFPSEGF